MAEINLKRSELIHEWQQGSIAGIAGNELVIRYVFKNGVDDGYMIDSHNAIKRFPTDEKTWSEIEKIKCQAGKNK